jgi:hypothetical protein
MATMLCIPSAGGDCNSECDITRLLPFVTDSQTDTPDSATANNGRRKELQQHFVLHLKVMGTLANNHKVVLAESITAPVVVRGRSPRNFQARKEIPLLGSSAGSRGQALVESGLGVVAGVAGKAQESKARAMDIPPVPRSAFTFSPPKPGPNQLNPARSR